MTTASLQFDPARLSSELGADNAAFRLALDAVALEQRKAETTLETRNARLADAKRIDLACRRIYEGFFLLADRPDLLDRLGRALRRVRRAVSSTSDEPPSDDEPSEAASSVD